MILEKYFFINHFRNDFSLTLNLVSLILVLIILLVFYLIYRRKRVDIIDLLWKSVIFFILVFSFLVVINEINWFYKDLRELYGKNNIEKASVLYSRYFYSDRLFSYLKSVKENTEKDKTAILLSPHEFDRIWLKYYLFPDISILNKDTSVIPDYFLVFINSEIYPDASMNASFPGFKLLKEFSNTEKIYVNNNL